MQLCLNILQLVRSIPNSVLDTTEYVVDSGDVSGTVITQLQSMHTAMFQRHGVTLLQRLKPCKHSKPTVFADLRLGIVRLDKAADRLHQCSSCFFPLCVYHATNAHRRESVHIWCVMLCIVLHVVGVVLNELLLLLNLLGIFIPHHVFHSIPLISPAVSGSFQLGNLNVQFHLLF